MKQPLVSILVPVYRVEDYIERCARSLFEQTYGQIEYIFVDDCTPDASILILKRVMADYPQRAENVRIINHEKNLGLATARNTLVEYCQGEFLSHVDSDDWLEPNAIELLVNKQQETGADIVTGRNQTHCKIRIIPARNAGTGMDKWQLTESLMIHQYTSVLWARLIRTRLYTDHHIKADSRGNIGEEFQVFPRLLYYAHSIAFLDEIIYHYTCENPYSYSHSFLVNIGSQLQYLLAHQIVSAFFSDKVLDYSRRCDQTAVIYAYQFLKEWVKRGNRKGYEAMRGLLKESYHQYYSTIKWNQWPRRVLFNNFVILRFCLFVKDIVR